MERSEHKFAGELIPFRGLFNLNEQKGILIRRITHGLTGIDFHPPWHENAGL